MQVFTGKKSLPSKEEMHAELEREQLRRPNDYTMQFPYGSPTVIIDKLAEEVGCSPDLTALQNTSPKVYDMFWKNTVLASHFRYVDEATRESCLAVMRQCDEVIHKTYQLNVDLSASAHNEIYQEMYDKFCQNYKLPREFLKYLLKC